MLEHIAQRGQQELARYRLWRGRRRRRALSVGEQVAENRVETRRWFGVGNVQTDACTQKKTMRIDAAQELQHRASVMAIVREKRRQPLRSSQNMRRNMRTDEQLECIIHICRLAQHATQFHAIRVNVVWPLDSQTRAQSLCVD